MLSHFLRAAAKNINFVASATAEGTASSVTVNKPTGTVQGDIMVAWMINRSTSGRTWTQLTGWTKAAQQTTPANVAVQYKVAGASEGSTYTFVSDGGNNCIAGIATFRYGAYDTVGTIGTATSGGNCTASAITVASDNCVVLAMFAQNAGGSFPTPTGFTQIYNVTHSGNDAQLACFYKVVSKGSTGNVSSDPSGTGSVAGVLLSIKPNR